MEENSQAAAGRLVDHPPSRSAMGRRAALGALWAAAALSSAAVVAAAPTRVLFVGNSFTFVNDLPHQLINIARSLGHEIEVANSTIGGCTAYYQRADTDARTAELLQQVRRGPASSPRPAT